MNEILAIYNNWVGLVAVAKKRREEYASVKKQYDRYGNLRYPMSEEHEKIYNDFMEAVNTKWHVENTLFKALDKKVFILPDGNVLVPCWDDGMNESVQIMERYHD